MQQLRRSCSLREYCREDIRTKALKKFGREQQTADKAGLLADQAVDMLTDEGFVCEQRYACAYVRDKSALSGWGAAKIRHFLLGKGIPKEIVEQALGEIDSQKSSDKLRRALEAKYKALAPKCGENAALRQRMLRLALSRGHDYDSSIAIIQDIINSHQK